MSENEETARLIPLESVSPDPDQPRHLLPQDLAQALVGGGSPRDVLTELRARAERDRWVRDRLRELDSLAQSIGEDGLLQPIRVIQDGEGRYRIEEGERRWWAHHLLVQQGREEFRSIKAFVVASETAAVGVLRRRVAENLLRSEFTAIELARAMAKRIEEILSAEPGTKRGDAERRVGSENGMSDRRVRQFVALLTLAPEAQELAQQARLTENSLRPILGIQDEARQLAAIRAMMHPHQQVTKSRRNRTVAKPSPVSRKAIRSARTGKPPARINLKSAGPSKRSGLERNRPVRALDAKRSALRDLLSLAKLFSEQGLRLDSADWTRLMKTETDRAVLVNFQTVLQEGLSTCRDASENGTQP